MIIHGKIRNKLSKTEMRTDISIVLNEHSSRKKKIKGKATNIFFLRNFGNFGHLLKIFLKIICQNIKERKATELKKIS